MSRQRQFSLIREALPNPAFLALVLELRSTLRGCTSVLDLGCGSDSPARFLNDCRLVGLDGYGPALDQARARNTHDEYHLGDVRKADEILNGRRFDACVALDVIEHLEKDDGWRFLDMMERLATRRVILLTPNGFVPQQSTDGDLQEHLSGWSPEEMRDRGYVVHGMHGPKGLRGEHARLKYRPRVFWSLVSVAGHYGRTRRRAESAFSIYCVKELGGSSA